MHLVQGSGTRTAALKVKLYFEVWKVIRRIRFMARGILELLQGSIATTA